MKSSHRGPSAGSLSTLSSITGGVPNDGSSISTSTLSMLGAPDPSADPSGTGVVGVAVVVAATDSVVVVVVVVVVFSVVVVVSFVVGAAGTTSSVTWTVTSVMSRSGYSTGGCACSCVAWHRPHVLRHRICRFLEPHWLFQISHFENRSTQISG
jgi:hypothetical protein